MPADAARVIFDLHKIGGQAFPVTVAQQAAVFAMKMPTAGLSESARIAWLNDMIIDGVKQLAKKDSRYSAYAEDLMKGINTSAQGGKEVVSMLAVALADPGVVARLTARHTERAALAVSVADREGPGDCSQCANLIFTPACRLTDVVGVYLYLCEHGYGEWYLAGGRRAPAFCQLRRYRFCHAEPWNGDPDEHTTQPKTRANLGRAWRGLPTI
jgi:hypothetical protein